MVALPQVAPGLRMHATVVLTWGVWRGKRVRATRRMDMSGSQGRLGWRQELGFHKYGADGLVRGRMACSQPLRLLGDESVVRAAS